MFAADTSELYSFQIKFDQAENWQRGPGDPGSNEADTRSVAAHEFGHATGLAGHFDNDSNACTDAPIHTMCPFHTLGTTRQRSLEEHDRHTFNNAY